MATKTETCMWREYDGAWEASCGHDFFLNDGTPAENNMRFCCFCGRHLVERVETDEDDDHDNQD